MNIFRESSPLAWEALGALTLRPALAQPEDAGPARLRRGWELWGLALGRLTEVSGGGGGGGLTLASSFVGRAQSLGKSVLWLSSEVKPFYPPDMGAAGVALERLPVVFLSRPVDAALVAARLLSSGGFDLLVWDLASWKKAPARLPVGHLARLGALARHHRAVVLILTEKERKEPSLGCLVALRLQVEALRGDPSLLRIDVLKDKRGAVGEGKEWLWRCGLPSGLPPSAPLPGRLPGPLPARAG
jgi:hypothetical protein